MHRGWMDHPAFKGGPYSQREAWCWLIEHANYGPGQFLCDGTIHDIPRGSVATRYRALAREWQWSVNRVIRGLEVMKTCSMVDVKTEQGFVLITLCNYERYQAEPADGGTATEQQRNSNGTATDTKQRREERKKGRRKGGVTLDSLEVSHVSEWAATNIWGVNQEAALARFKDYWRSTNKPPLKDWTAGFRNWLRTDMERSTERRTPSKGEVRSNVQTL